MATELPADLSSLSDEQLQTFHKDAVKAFDTVYGDGSKLTEESLTELGVLTSQIETLSAAIATRAEGKTAALAVEAPEPPVAEVVAPVTTSLEELAATLETLSEDATTIVASGADGKTVEYRLPQGRNREVAAAMRLAAQTAKSSNRSRQGQTFVKAKGDSFGVIPGTDLSLEEMGKALDRKLASDYQHGQYAAAARAGRQLKQLGSFATIQRQFPAELTVMSNDPEHVYNVVQRAVNEKSLPGGSLLASGGWHAPSEVLYTEFLELESRDGILTIPEISVARGGVQMTPGPSYQDIFSSIKDFNYTEAQDEAAEYGIDSSGEGDSVSGSKPVYHVTAPSFTEYRLDVDGLILQSGLLAAKGYPEHLARVIRGALVAHDHIVNSHVINALAAGSTAVSLTAAQVGTTAPVLGGLEMQIEHYRHINRMTRASTIEVVAPYWVRGAIRSDLSRRLGYAEGDSSFNITDAQIDAWFAVRGASIQYVYDWQDIASTAAGSFTAWPTSVKFLLYAAGTWVKGTSDILTLDTLYDSTLLGKNDYTALFTEEGWFAARAGVDSRVLTVPISSDGSTHIGVTIANDGAAS